MIFRDATTMCVTERNEKSRITPLTGLNLSRLISSASVVTCKPTCP